MDAPSNECEAKKDLLLGGFTEVSVKCGREAGHDGVWHCAQETLEEAEGERVGYVQFWWREELS